MNILLLSKISKVYQQKFGNFGSLILMRLLDLLEQVEGPHPAAHAELDPAPYGGHAVQLWLVHLGLNVGSPGAEVKGLDGALARIGQHVAKLRLTVQCRPYWLLLQNKQNKFLVTIQK